MLVSSVRVRLFGVRTSSARGLVATHKARPDQPHAVASSAARSLARRASPYRRRTLDVGARGVAAVEGRRGNKLIDIGGVCLLAGRACFRPSTVDGPGASSSTGQRRSAGPRLVQGSRARRANARGRSTTPHLVFTRPRLEGQARESARRGRAAASWGRRATRVPRGWRRGRRACAPPQAPLEVVEKFLTRQRRTLAKFS
jgi:hypothetical protein